MSVQELEQHYVEASAGGGRKVSSSTEIVPAQDETPVESTPSEGLAAQSLVNTMVRTSTVLDQGFLPGVDSREPAQEQSQPSFGNTASLEVRVYLPEPPSTR